MGRPTQRFSFLVLCALGLLGGLSHWVSSPAPVRGALGSGFAPRGPSHPEFDLAPVSNSAATAVGARVEADAEAPRVSEGSVLAHGERALRLRVVDESLMVPVTARILKSGGAPLARTDVLGEALIPWSGRGPGPMTVEAHGFHSTVVVPEPSDLERGLAVTLAPEGTARVEVSDRSGEPFEGVVVRFRAVPEGTHPILEPRQHVPDSAWTRTAVTDSRGVAAVALGARAIAELESPDGLGAEVFVAPDSGTTRVILDRQPARVLLVDAATGEPLPDFSATLKESNHPGSREGAVVSDSSGAILIPAAARGVVLRLTDPRRRRAQCAAGSRFTSDGEGVYFRFDQVEPGETFVIEVETCGVSLLLVDAETNLPLAGVVEVRNEHQRQDKASGAATWSSFSFSRRSAPLRSGSLNLDCIFLPTSPNQRIRLRVDGYLDELLLHTGLVPGALPRIVPMTKGGASVAVTLRHRDGRPARGRFFLFDLASGVRQESVEADATGTVTLRRWTGGDIDVVRTVPNFTHSRPPVPMGIVRSHQIQDGRALLMVGPSAARGSLTVHGRPDGSPPIFADDIFGTRYGASRVSGGEVLFDDLEAGAYFIGTAQWLDALCTQSFRPDVEGCETLRVTVEAGGVKPLPWDPRWAAARSLSGRVIASPECLSTLALRPWYGVPMGSIAAFDELRIYLDAEGRYTIPRGAPIPERLLVCPTSDSYWIQVLQSFLPGKSVEIPSGHLRIEWEGPPPREGYATVLYQTEGLTFEAPFELTNDHGYYCQWNTVKPLVLDSVSTFVQHVSLEVKTKGKERTQFPVQVRPNRPSTLGVSLDGFRRSAVR